MPIKHEYCIIFKKLVGKVQPPPKNEQWLKYGTEVMQMEPAAQESGLVLIHQMGKEELGKIVAELIKNDRGVQKAILNLAFSCPNIVMQI